EAEENDVREQCPPVAAVTVEEAAPVEPVADGPDEVGDVGAVEALAFHDQPLRPDHLLRRDELDVHLEDLAGDGALEPELVDDGDAVAGAEDEVDEVLPFPSLADPVREGELGAIAGGLKKPAGAVEVGAADEDVEVLGLTL